MAFIGPVVITVAITIGMLWRFREHFIVRTPRKHVDDDGGIW